MKNLRRANCIGEQCLNPAASAEKKTVVQRPFVLKWRFHHPYLVGTNPEMLPPAEMEVALNGDVVALL